MKSIQRIISISMIFILSINLFYSARLRTDQNKVGVISSKLEIEPKATDIKVSETEKTNAENAIDKDAVNPANLAKNEIKIMENANSKENSKNESVDTPIKDDKNYSKSANKESAINVKTRSKNKDENLTREISENSSKPNNMIDLLNKLKENENNAKEENSPNQSKKTKNESLNLNNNSKVINKESSSIPTKAKHQIKNESANNNKNTESNNKISIENAKNNANNELANNMESANNQNNLKNENDSDNYNKSENTLNNEIANIVEKNASNEALKNEKESDRVVNEYNNSNKNTNAENSMNNNANKKESVSKLNIKEEVHNNNASKINPNNSNNSANESHDSKNSKNENYMNSSNNSDSKDSSNFSSKDNQKIEVKNESNDGDKNKLNENNNSKNVENNNNNKKNRDANIYLSRSEDLQAANKNSTKIAEEKFQAVTYVKELSPAGKASLELMNTQDPEYVKLINSGFESPSFTTSIFENKSTLITTPQTVNQEWQPLDPKEKDLWQNVEFNRYDNRLLDTSRYYTPAHFTINGGNKIVHAPSDHDLTITRPVNTMYGMDNIFLDLEDETAFKFDDDKLDESLAESKIEEHMNKIYSFLKN